MNEVAAFIRNYPVTFVIVAFCLIGAVGNIIYVIREVKK